VLGAMDLKYIRDYLDNLHGKKFCFLILILIVVANVSIILDIAYYRQFFAFILLTIFPGTFLIYFLKLDGLGISEKAVLAIGLSVSFLMCFGIFLNQMSLLFGYRDPLSTSFLVISISLALIVLFLGAYLWNNNAFSALSLSFETKISEKLLLIFLAIYIQMIIIGTQFNSIYHNNFLLLFATFLLPIFMALITFRGAKISATTYTLAIIMISFSLLAIYWLRSDHILGHDVHTEYYLSYMTLLNGHWSILSGSSYDSCLSISLLPAIFQSLLHIKNDEQLFKGIYVLICSFTPLIVFIISRKYLQIQYAFLASMFSVFQTDFIAASGSPRTNLCIFFIALFIMVLFCEDISIVKRRILSIIFLANIIFSHYSSTYIFLSLLVFAFLGTKVLDKYVHLRNMTLNSLIFFVVFIFIWYGQLTNVPFNYGVMFFERTISSMGMMFVEEAKSPQIALLYGSGMQDKPLLSWINWGIRWTTFIFIGVGVIYSIIRINTFLATRLLTSSISKILIKEFDVEFVLLAFASGTILIALLVVPYLTVGYEIGRTYALTSVILAPFFILGGIISSNYLKLNSYIILLISLILIYMFTIGSLHEFFGIGDNLILVSKSTSGDYELVHDPEIYATQWIALNRDVAEDLDSTDHHGLRKLVSQGKISPIIIDRTAFSNHVFISGYLFLSYNNVINGKLLNGESMPQGFERKPQGYNMSEFDGGLLYMNKIYANGESELWKRN
jgi:uncharacterized membrane protein